MKKNKKGISLGVIILGIIVIIVTIFLIKKIMLKEKVNSENNESISNSEQVTDAIFKVNDIKSSKGKEITVEIELLNNSDFVAANFEYRYDSSSLEYISYEIGNSLKDGAMNLVNNDKAKDKVLIGFVAKPDGEKEIKSGKIIDIKFRVKDNLAQNNINNKFECTTLKKEDGTDVKFNIHQGKIEVN